MEREEKRIKRRQRSYKAKGKGKGKGFRDIRKKMSENKNSSRQKKKKTLVGKLVQEYVSSATELSTADTDDTMDGDGDATSGFENDGEFEQDPKNDDDLESISKNISEINGNVSKTSEINDGNAPTGLNAPISEISENSQKFGSPSHGSSLSKTRKARSQRKQKRMRIALLCFSLPLEIEYLNVPRTTDEAKHAFQKLTKKGEAENVDDLTKKVPEDLTKKVPENVEANTSNKSDNSHTTSSSSKSKSHTTLQYWRIDWDKKNIVAKNANSVANDQHKDVIWIGTLNKEGWYFRRRNMWCMRRIFMSCPRKKLFSFFNTSKLSKEFAFFI